MKDVAVGFAALSQETRLALMRQLAAKGVGGMAAGELASALGQLPSTLSFHLSALEQAGLVRSRRQGRHVVYAVRLSGLRALFGFIAETCSPWRPGLGGELARLLPAEAEDDPMQASFNVLFLCTHNSARSLMAQSILEQVGKGRFNAYSAGSDPAANPMPEVIAKLRVLGHDVSGLHSKSWEKFTASDAPRMDFVITLCDTLQGQICPDFGARVVTSAWPLPDPAKFTGSDIERASMINGLYGMIRRRLEAFINLPYATLDAMALKKRLDELGDINNATV